MTRVFCTGLFLLFSGHIFSQSLYKHPSTLGIHAALYDFKNPSPLQKLGALDPGLSLVFLKGLNNRFDLQAGVTGAFPDSTSKQVSGTGQSFLLQTDLSLRLRFRGGSRSFQPFLLSGLGFSHHKKEAGGYFLAGPGVEWNYKGVYFLVSARYQLGLGKSLNNHFYYSVGVAGLLSKPKKQKAPVQAAVSIKIQPPPDSDRDGIVDSADACPAQPGLAKFNGCPDTDGDGIIDEQDHCPTVLGYEQYKGCPIPDQDRDGISDEHDQCPVVPGTEKYKGCPVPDRDGDGVNDEEDNCIDVAGLRSNKGCPVIAKEVITQIDLAAKNIFFKTGSFELLPKSYPALDDVVRILKENPAMKLSIEGHTDNVGGEQSNQLLSENRAKAVAKYLLDKGISSSRLATAGYGMQRPVAGNDTEEGRAKNRRVEMKAGF
jgi:OOP family OmpA-OmpF porin